MLKGIDISKWQGNIDIAATGAEFVIAKATQGTGYVDPLCDRHYQLAKSLGKKLGVYHYASGGDPIAEADFFVNNIKGYLNEAILVLDWESNQNARFGEHASWCLPFLARVYQRTGIKGVIYMSASVIRAADWSSLVRNDYGLWVAGYPDNRNSWDIPNFPYSISPWSFYALWQYTSSAGTLDRDVFAGDRDAWDKYANVKVTVIEPTPTPTPEPTPVAKVSWVNMDVPRVLVAKSDIKKFDVDAKQYVGDVALKAGDSRKFLMKATVDNNLYVKTEYDVANNNPTGFLFEDLKEYEPVVETPVEDTTVDDSTSTSDNNNNNNEETDMSEPTTPETTSEPTITSPDHNRGLSAEEFAALQTASAFTTTDGYKPTIPDNIRLAVYLASGVGTPLVALVYQMLAVYGIVTADLAVQVITIVATFFGTIAGLFGISHFTKSK